MKNVAAKLVLVFGILLTSNFVLLTSVSAQFDACDFLPCGQVNDGQDITDSGVSGDIEDWIQFGLNLIFIVFILLGAAIVLKSALTYIRSQGDEGKIEEGTKAIKSVFIGVGILIIGILGILFLLIVTGGLDLLDRETNNLPDGVNDIPFLN